MKKNLLYIVLCIFTLNAGAQTLNPNVISTAGNYYTGAGLTWSWTLGDTYIPTVSNGTNMLSQGFQQPEVQVIADTFTNPICAGSTFSLPYTSYSVIGSNNVYTAQLSDASGSFAAPTNVGTVTGNKSGTINVTIPGGTLTGNGYKIRVVSSLPVFNTRDPGISIAIVATSVASVNVSTSQNSICSGTNATFTAQPTNGGADPSFQWKVNGNNVGTNSSSYSSTTVNTGDVITCVMTSNAACVTGSPATSNSVNMTVTQTVKDSVSVSTNPGATICSGTNVTFTAAPFNGGSTPAYQWMLNNTNVGTNSNTFSSSSLNNGDIITCVVTSNATCVTGSPATSDAVTITVSATIPLTASVSASSNSICSGTNVDFNASTSGGPNSNYQWKVNGSNAGTNSSTFSSASLNNGDIVTCVISSSSTCVTGSPAVSNLDTIQVTQSQVASVNIASPNTTVCAGNPATFTATPGTSGLVPSYQWQVNGSNVGTNSTTFSSGSLNSGDVITCILTSAANCVTGTPATSNQLTITVNANSVAGTISTPKNTICQSTLVHLSLSGNSGGGIQWQSSPDSLTGFAPLASGTNPTYVSPPLGQTTFYRVIVGTGPCADTTTSFKITVIPAPLAAYSYTVSGKKVTFDGSLSTGGTSYTWDFGDGTTSTDENPVHTFDSVKTYHVCLTVKNTSNCNFTVCQNVETFNTGVNNLTNDASWLVYPDPFGSQLYISTGQTTVSAESIEMYDLLGRKVFYQQVSNVLDNPTKINVQDLIPGVYFLSIKTKDGSFVKQVVKQS